MIRCAGGFVLSIEWVISEDFDLSSPEVRADKGRCFRFRIAATEEGWVILLDNACPRGKRFSDHDGCIAAMKEAESRLKKERAVNAD